MGGGKISWPSCSPDSTQLDYFLRVKLKRAVYRDSPRTIDELKTKIRYVIQVISEETLRRVYKNTKNHQNSLQEKDVDLSCIL